ncbi:MAG TPA: antitoxin Xre/MbcA/ParS toxin-binding domain-containing protein [Tepidisphaeraceae bacterium]|jgi:putative toxin-antitoxin system antitoxin component (TIGR02293 family)
MARPFNKHEIDNLNKRVERLRHSGMSRTAIEDVVFHRRAGRFGNLSQHKAFESIENGLATAFVDYVADLIDVPQSTVLSLTRISTSSFARRKTSGLLSSEESDRVYRLKLIADKTLDFFEDNHEAAGRWLKTPAPALRGFKPLDLLVNEAGVREVEALLGRLEHGVFT